jgi:hypothetical protein
MEGALRAAKSTLQDPSHSFTCPTSIIHSYGSSSPVSVVTRLVRVSVTSIVRVFITLTVSLVELSNSKVTVVGIVAITVTVAPGLLSIRNLEIEDSVTSVVVVMVCENDRVVVLVKEPDVTRAG